MNRNQHGRRLGVGSGEVVVEQLDLMLLELHQLAYLPRVKANFNARSRDNTIDLQGGRPQETVAAWLLLGPGLFLGFRYYQVIHAKLKKGGLLPLLHLVSISRGRKRARGTQGLP
jgi:hypothetical protein